ncbi:TIM barrel protein [Ferviditalea candida]|uniref:TIM barrel protein n=1 Tax=Ferviditalea candida TaxID=3108399 RepID=A0ABU5ZN50_9BACL|nr:TIM barrel protein [Paenibacillaceae bacterium T2]
MKFSVVIPMIFHQLPLVDGLRKAHGTGMLNAEVMHWQEVDVDELIKVKEQLNMNVVMMNTQMMQLADPTLHTAFLDGLSYAIEISKKFGCSNLFCVPGIEVPSVTRSVQKDRVIAVLKEAAKMLEQAGSILHLEPLNTKIDHPGQFLSSSDEAFDMVKWIGSPNVKVLFDIYHQQVTEGDVMRRMAENIDYIGHIHASNNPGRTKIPVGELNYPYIFEELDKLNYKGYVGIEYLPHTVEDAVEDLMEFRRIYG